MRLTHRRGEDRILTVPNLVTVVRLLCIPLFIWLLARPNRSGYVPAAVLLAVLGATDGVDGYVARHFHQVSSLGKVLDPVADRLLLGVAALAIVIVGAVPTWVAVAALSREALVALGFLVVAAAGGRRVDVQWAGKAGTFGLMFAYPTFLLAHGHAGWQHPIEIVAWVSAVPALVLAWIAAASYVPLSRRALVRGRANRMAAG
jgi:cardiolipin synthase (CMP-forming)